MSALLAGDLKASAEKDMLSIYTRAISFTTEVVAYLAFLGGEGG
jgi:hypothetical protein